MRMKIERRIAISTAATVGIIVVILVIAAVAGYFVLTSSGGKTTSTSSTSTTSTTHTTTTSTTHTTSTSPPTTSTSSAPITYGPTNSSVLVDESQGGAYDALDPAYAFYLQDTAMLNAVFQDLVELNGTSGSSIVPILADTYGTTNNGATNWFHMRANTWFSDGTNITSYDAWYSMVRMLYMNTPSFIGGFNWANILYNFSAGNNEATGQWAINNCNLWLPFGLREAIASATGNSVADAKSMAGCNYDVAFLNSMLSHFDPTNTTQLAVMQYKNQALVAPNSTYFISNYLLPIGDFGFQLYSGFDGEQIVNPAWVGTVAGGVTNNSVNSYFDNHGAEIGAGSGPYYIASVGASLSPVVFKTNPDYWAQHLSFGTASGDLAVIAQPPKIPEIQYVVPSGDTQIISDFGTNRAQLSAESIAEWQTMYNSFGMKQYFHFNQLLQEEGAFPFTLWWDMAHQVFPTNITQFDRFFIAAINYTQVNAPNLFNGSYYASYFVAPLTPAFAPYYNSGNLPNPAVQNTTLAFNDLNQAGMIGHFFTFIPTGFTLSNGTAVNAGQCVGDCADARHAASGATQLPPVKLYYTVPLLSELQAQLQGIISDLGVFGVSATAVGSTSAQFNILTGTASTYPEFLTLGWGPDYLDPFLSMYEPLMLPSPYNGWFTNSTVIAEVNACLTPATQTAALACSTALNKMAFDNAIWAPFPDTSYYYFWIQPYVSGMVNNPFVGYWYQLLSYTPVTVS